MKPKSIILNNLPDRVAMVYTPSSLARIAKLTDLNPTPVSGEAFRSMDVSDVEFIFTTWGMVPLTDEEVQRMPRLRAVFHAAGATDGFARPFLRNNVVVVSVWQANAIPVAEFTFSQILLGLKGFFYNNRILRETRKFSFDGAGPGAYGEEVALLGAGAISSRVQHFLENCDVKVTVMPSHPERRTVSLDELFRRAFVISNHLPNRVDNKRVITQAHFESMRPGAVFINTGRGAQVDEEGMLDVMESRPDLTAIIDVTEPEPPSPDSRLFTLPNVYLSGHIAGSWNDEVHRMADFVVAELERFLAGEPLLYQVHESMLISS